MAEKVLQTRIQLKYDTYDQWDKVKSTFTPKKGEVCIVEIPAETGVATNEPTVLFKVGDGSKTFENLPWSSALAADVYSWAKAADVEFKDQKINFKRSNGTIIKTLDLSDFVTGAELSESEDIIVGGTDNVSGEVFDGFDYVALGHIHREQTVGKDNIRYCGTPLKYSFSEAKHIKSVTILDFKDKENIEYSKIPLTPLRDMREIRGTYDELTLKSNYENTNVDDYLHITLTDEEDIPDAIGKLRSIYPNIMKLDYDNLRTRGSGTVDAIENIESKSPFELFADLFKQQNNQDMSEEQEEIMRNLIDKIWEEN